MKVPERLILVSKQSILNKHFNIDMAKFNALSETEKEIARESLFPTENEKAFMEIHNSKAPQLARLQRKMSVCLEVEVLEYDHNFIVFEYAGNTYRMTNPRNAYRICQALENDDSLSGLWELAKQGCLQINDKVVTDLDKDEILQVDEIMLLKKIASKFFFQPFMI